MTTLREKMKQEMTLCGYSPSTQDVYLRSVVKLHDHFNRNPAELTEEEIKAFLLLTLASKSISVSTYNIIIYGLKFFYERVLDKKMVAIKLPRHKEPQKLPDILSSAEVERIIKATSNLKYRTLFILIYGAGLRVSEAATLCIQDIDSDRSTIHIRQGKGGKDRYVTLSPMMLKTLRMYWRQCRLKTSTKGLSPNFILIGSPGKAISTYSIGAAYRRSKEIANIKKQGGVHALHHAFATHALEAGTDLYTIKQILGHASITSTVRYCRMMDKACQIIQSPVELLSL
jgi:integrase/recombinase XerD